MSWAAVAAAGVSVAGSYLSAGAAGDAAGAQNSAGAAAAAENAREYDQSRNDNMPFLRTGTQANTRLRTLLGLGNSQIDASTMPRFQGDAQAYNNQLNQWLRSQPNLDATTMPSLAQFGGNNAAYQNAVDQWVKQQNAPNTDPDFGKLTRDFTLADRDADPVYQAGLQFGLDQGTKGINSRAIATGGYDSGATLKALTQFGNDYGSTKTADSKNRFIADNTNTYNRLAGISGTGQTAANTVGAAGQNYSNNAQNLLTGMGNATAAGIVGGANAWGSASNSITNAANGYNSQQTLNALLNRNSGYSSNNIGSYGNFTVPQSSGGYSTGID